MCVVQGVEWISVGKPQLMLLLQPVTAGAVRRADVYLWGNTCNITALHTETHEPYASVQKAETVVLVYNFGSKQCSLLLRFKGVTNIQVTFFSLHTL